MDSKCPWGKKPTKKEEKDFKRTKFIITPLTDILSSKYHQFSIYQNQTGKKDQDY